MPDVGAPGCTTAATTNDASRVLERPKHVLPDTLFFETTEEPFPSCSGVYGVMNSCVSR